VLFYKKKSSRKPVTLEIKAERTELCDDGMKNCDIYKKFVLGYTYLLKIFIGSFSCHNRISKGYSIICFEYLYISFQAIRLVIYNFFFYLGT
jgi:hypothetical protein